MRPALLLAIGLAWPALAMAADPAPAPPGLLWPALKMVVGLALVVGVLLLFYAAQRRGFGLLPGQRESRIRIVESKALGGRKYLCLVQVRGRELLLGISPDRIELLERLGEVGDFSRELAQAEQQP